MGNLKCEPFFTFPELDGQGSSDGWKDKKVAVHYLPKSMPKVNRKKKKVIKLREFIKTYLSDVDEIVEFVKATLTAVGKDENLYPIYTHLYDVLMENSAQLDFKSEKFTQW